MQSNIIATTENMLKLPHWIALFLTVYGRLRKKRKIEAISYARVLLQQSSAFRPVNGNR